MAAVYWGHEFGFGYGFFAGLVWLGVVVYVLILVSRLVRAIERVATKFESKP